LKQIFKHASSLAQTIEEEAEAFGWKISSDTPAAVVAGAVLDSSSATEAATASQFQRATRKHDWERLAEGVRRLRRSAQSEAIDGLRKSGVAIVQALPTIADSKRCKIPSARLTLPSTKLCTKFKNFRKKYLLVLRLPWRRF
jgi:hypothetical protein